MAMDDIEKQKIKSSVRRKHHFDNDGDPAMWRGRSVRFSDKKKEASKKACRTKPEVEGD